jgi:hypothetical protein
MSSPIYFDDANLQASVPFAVQIPANTTSYNQAINSSDFDRYILRNVQVVSSTAWYNVSSEANNNSLFISNFTSLTSTSYLSQDITNYPNNLNDLVYQSDPNYYTSDKISVYGGKLNFVNTGSYFLKVFEFSSTGAPINVTTIDITLTNSLTLNALTTTIIIQGYLVPQIPLSNLDKNNIVNATVSIQYGTTQYSGTIIIPDNYYVGLTTLVGSTGFDAIIGYINDSDIMTQVDGEVLVKDNTYISMFKANSTPYYLKFLGTTNTIFGFNDKDYLVTGCLISDGIISPDEDGRFSAFNILCNNLSAAIQGESRVICKVLGGGFGSVIQGVNYYFTKELGKPFSTLSLRVVDNQNNPLLVNDIIYVSFLVDFYTLKNRR